MKTLDFNVISVDKIAIALDNTKNIDDPNLLLSYDFMHN